MQHCQSNTRRARRWPPSIIGDLFFGALILLILTAMTWPWWSTPPWGAAVAVLAYLTLAGCLLLCVPAGWRQLGWANRVTLGRGVLIALLTGSLADSELMTHHAAALALLALVALALDGVDGWLARRTATQSDFGARFDMELDAFFILVLCLALVVLGKAGPWVLAIGTMRYAFLMAGLRLTWLNAPLPSSYRRKAICVWQVVALILALLPMADTTVTAWLAGSALAGLIGSFSIDVRWLYRHASARQPEECRLGSPS